MGKSKTKPILCALLSALWPGLGQIANGQLKKGLLLLVLQCAFLAAIHRIFFASGFTLNAGCCILGIPLFFSPLLILAYAVFDSYVVAKQQAAGRKQKDIFE